jgi:excisionase family DNA binding protein
MVTPKKPDPDKTILSPAEACYVIGLSWNTLRDLIRKGDIRAVRLKRRYLIPKEAIDAFLNRDRDMARVMVRSMKR